MSGKPQVKNLDTGHRQVAGPRVGDGRVWSSRVLMLAFTD